MLEESWHIHNWRERRNRSLHYNIQLLLFFVVLTIFFTKCLEIKIKVKWNLLDRYKLNLRNTN